MTPKQSNAILASGRRNNLSNDETIKLVQWKAEKEGVDPKSKEICDFFIGKTDDDRWKMELAIDEYNDFIGKTL
jgi:hypothetical protein